ncbi:hypothetical protein SO694_00015493 [Aureococcus anophagefferens]|uniref:SLC26A/SulP transporter domain-containing protein n=1 Tax=Aureococcus anophagefferens TaxID=44056 RepID=A0ABR1G3V0_AURAN
MRRLHEELRCAFERRRDGGDALTMDQLRAVGTGEEIDRRAARVDGLASCVAYLVTCVIYVSTAQSVFGKLDPRLVYVGVDGALLGTAATGLYFAQRSRVPWCVASVDVGFAPLLAQLAELCWNEIVGFNGTYGRPWSFGADGRSSYLRVTAGERRAFVATFVAASSLIFALCGVVLLALGRLRLTKALNFLPYPVTSRVTSGMLASIGVSLLKSGAHVAAFGGFRVSFPLGAAWLALATGLAAGARAGRRLFPRAPTWAPPVLVVLVGTLLLEAGLWYRGASKEEAAFVGARFDWDNSMLDKARGWSPLFDIESLGGPKHAPRDDDDAPAVEEVKAVPFIRTLADCALAGGGDPACAAAALLRRAAAGYGAFLRAARWDVVFKCRGVVGAAVLIGAIKIGIKTGAFPSLFPDEDVDVDGEMAMIGAANVAASLLGAQGTAYSFSALKLAQHLGASKRGVGSLLPACCLAAWLLGFGVLKYVPRFVYGALLLDLGWDYVETYLLAPLRRRDLVGGEDLCTVLAVVVTAAATSLLEAVAVGVVLCLAGTALRLSQTSVVAAAASGADVRSTIERKPREAACLDARGNEIFFLTLRGYLFFGSAAELLAVVHERLRSGDRVGHLVLDLRQCYGSLDFTAVSAFRQLEALGDARGFRVAVAPRLPALAKALDAATFHDSADDALELCEDALIAAAAPRRRRPPLGRELLVAGADRRGRARPGAVGVNAYYAPDAAAHAAPERRLTLAAAAAARLLRLPYDAVAHLDGAAPGAAILFHKLMARTLGGRSRATELAAR